MSTSEFDNWKIFHNKSILLYKEAISDIDLNKIYDFFWQKHILDILWIYENKRVKFIKLLKYFVLLLLCFFILFIFISDYKLILRLLSYIIAIYGAIIVIIFIKVYWWLKSSLFPEFVSKNFEWMKYSQDWLYFNESIEEINNKIGFLEKYDTIDKQEDSIKYVFKTKWWDNIEVIWKEIQTSNTYKYFWRPLFQIVSNHYYVVKIKLLDPRFLIKEKIIIKRKNFLNKLWLFWVTNYVKLENSDFMKQFDVVCKDWIEARKLLNPSMIEKIILLSKILWQNRYYFYYFYHDEIYILFSVNKWFMEISPFHNLFLNLKQYIEFYTYIKIINWLIDSLNINYYSK